MIAILAIYRWRSLHWSAAPAEAPNVADRRRLGSVAALSVVGMLVFGVGIQQVHLLNELAYEHTDRQPFFFSSWEVPPHWLLQLPVNLAFLVLLTPLVLLLWKRQAEAGREPSATRRMAAGALLTGACFLPLAGALLQIQSGGLASSWWLILSTGLLTLGELYFAPVALAVVTRVAPTRWLATSVALWLFFRDFLCDYVAVTIDRWRGGSSSLMFLVAMFLLAGALARALVSLGPALDRLRD
jgi:dipeptide/tripeptide permease